MPQPSAWSIVPSLLVQPGSAWASPQVAIFLLTAVIVVPLFRRLKLGAVLGYLAAGVLIGPWGLGLIGDAESTLHFAELGVVLLLFLVGLELEPSRLWALRHAVFGLGGAQVVRVRRWCWRVVAHVARPRVAGGDRRRLRPGDVVDGDRDLRGSPSAASSPSAHGRKTFAILLFQDLAVIPLIALLPLLAPAPADAESGWMLAAKGVRRDRAS